MSDDNDDWKKQVLHSPSNCQNFHVIFIIMPQKNQKGNGKTESLFMIEFLVDKCVIFQRSLPRKLRTIPGE